MRVLRTLDADLRDCVIQKEGDKWCLMTHDGKKKLGCHDTEAGAKEQEDAVKAQKFAAGGVIEKDGKFCHKTADGGEMCHASRAEAEAMVAKMKGPMMASRALAGAREGELRREIYQGREHLVVPVVALVEGVIHASNADTPELVLSEEFAKTVSGWNGRPVMLNHPKIGDDQVTANDPRTLEEGQIGTIFHAKADGKKLKMDAYLDINKMQMMGGEAHKMLASILEGKTNEVSVGTFVVAEPKMGSMGDKKFHYVWRDITSDHLAFLPEGVQGACSVEMGCGAPRAAESVITYLAASCGCGGQGSEGASAGGRTMDKKARVAAIIASGKTCFTTASAAALEALPDEELKKLEDHIAKPVETKTETKVEVKTPTPEEFLAANPDIKALVDANKQTPEQKREQFLSANPDIADVLAKHKAAAAKQKADLVVKLKTAQKAYNEDELNKLPIETLEKLAAIAIKEKPNYEGQIPRGAEGAEEDIPAPPSLTKHFREAAKKAAN